MVYLRVTLAPYSFQFDYVYIYIYIFFVYIYRSSKLATIMLRKRVDPVFRACREAVRRKRVQLNG